VKLPKILAKSSENGDNGAVIDPEPALKAYRLHGVQLSVRGDGAIGDCPFCGREGKLNAVVETGQFRCVVCNASGNPLTFIRLLWERSDKAAKAADGEELAKDRGFIDQLVLTQWGACRSIIDGTWLIPGYGFEGGRPRLDQLYRRTRMMSKGQWSWRLLPTPGIWPEGKVHALHMPSQHWDGTRQRIDVFEGPWDGMAWWEVASRCRRLDDGQLEFTGNVAASLAGDANVIAVPGAMSWRSEWTDLCKGKIVTIHYDNDHPKEHPPGSGNFTAAGRDGVQRISKLIGKVAKQVNWLQWGGGGYDSSLASGFDVRDWLVKGVEGRS
jgi:hypothetical protein